MAKLKRELVEIMDNNPNTIISEVCKEVLLHGNTHQSITNFFHDIHNHGCVCGMVGFLIYTTDVHTFFDRYYDEIEELREEYQENTGLSLSIQGDLKTYLSWFAFEEVSYKIAKKLKIFKD